MLSNIIFSLFLILSNLLLTSFAHAADVKTVSITQIVSHDSLDKVRDGIIHELKQKYSDAVNISLSNANGNIVTASQIATKLISNKPDLIIAIATPSAQAFIKLSRKHNIPILFATVSDPVGAGLVNSLENPGGNISGTRNISPIKEQLSLARELIPNLKKIGVVISMSEVNSAFMLKNLSDIAHEFGIEVQSKNVNNSGDVKLATESLVNEVDGFFLLQDNIVASGLTSLIKVATKANKPIISSYIEAVELGALAGLASEEYHIGKQTGQMAIRILEGSRPGSMPVEDSNKLELEINKDVATKLGIKISDSINEDYL